MVAAKQNQKFPFHFLSAPPTPSRKSEIRKENFWFLLPRPQGADEARRLVGIRILLKMRSDFVVQREPVSMKPKIRLARSASEGGGGGGNPKNQKGFPPIFLGEKKRPFRDSQTAKCPGRPIFNQMLDRMERGEADGILAWHPLC